MLWSHGFEYDHNKTSPNTDLPDDEIDMVYTKRNNDLHEEATVVEAKTIYSRLV